MRYIDGEKLKEIMLPSYEEAKKESLSATDAVKWEKVEYIFDFVFHLIDSLQQEQPTNTDNLCSELADFLIRNDVPEEKAKFLANRISDEYGSKKYLEGLCDGIKQEQPELSSNLIDADAVRDDFVAEVYRILDTDPTNDRANAIIDAFDSLPTISLEQPEVDLDEEIYFWLEGGGLIYPMSNKEKNNIKDTAHHFYELGQREMRRRITNPEYNAKVVEQLKSEYPTTKEDG